MADTKISALTAATTPLAGTEVLPIVQSGVTKQVSVADLTAGRAVSALSLTLTNALTAVNGGTGQTSYAVGDILYASTTTALSKLADVATGNALISGGVGVAPSWGKIALTTHVSGILPVANGGTNASSASITAFNNITGYAATGATGTTSTNLVFSTSPSITTATLVGDNTLSTGNLIQGTAAKGINFTANTGAAGKTSQLLNWYEEGTWTPSFGGSTTYYGRAGTYTRVGRLVFVEGYIHIDTNGSGSQTTISGLPFTPAASRDGIVFAYNTGLATNIVSLSGRVETGGTIVMYSRTAAATASAANNLCANAAYFEFSGCYYV